MVDSFTPWCLLNLAVFIPLAVLSNTCTYCNRDITPLVFVSIASPPACRSWLKCTLVQALRLCTGCMAHRGSRGIALLFLDHGTRRGWEVSVTPWPLFTPGNDPVPIVQEAEWAPEPVLDRCGKSRPLPGFDPETIQCVANCYTDYVYFMISRHKSNMKTSVSSKNCGEYSESTFCIIQYVGRCSVTNRCSLLCIRIE